MAIEAKRDRKPGLARDASLVRCFLNNGSFPGSLFRFFSVAHAVGIFRYRPHSRLEKSKNSLRESFAYLRNTTLAETGFLALRFTACLAGLYALWLSPSGQGCANGLATAYVRAGQTVVSMLGEPGIVHGATFFSRGQPVMTVATACTGSEFFLLLGAAILAFPATAAARAAGLLTGGVGLAGLGVLRIVSLYWVQVYRPGAFLAAHEEVWPAILAVATLAFLGSWIGCVQSRGHA